MSWRRTLPSDTIEGSHPLDVNSIERPEFPARAGAKHYSSRKRKRDSLPPGESDPGRQDVMSEGLLRDVSPSRLMEGENAHDTVDWEGLPRLELIQLLLQGLHDLGLRDAAQALEKESGTKLYSLAAQTLKDAVYAVDWARAESVLADLPLTKLERRAASHALAKQKFLYHITHTTESLTRGVEALEPVLQALWDLIDSCYDITTARAARRCAGLFVRRCTNLPSVEVVSQDEAANGVKGAQHHLNEERKKALMWLSVCRALPPHIVAPPKRLATLLHQALAYQEMACPHHEELGARQYRMKPSLLFDHECGPMMLPTQCVAVLQNHTNEIWHVAVANSGNKLASASKDCRVIIWANAAFLMPSVVVGQRKANLALDGSCPNPGSAGEGHDWRAHFFLEGHTGPVAAVAWSTDDRHIASGSHDKTVRVWEVEDSGWCVAVISRHEDAPTCLQWLSSGHLISGGLDERLCLWGGEDVRGRRGTRSGEAVEGAADASCVLELGQSDEEWSFLFGGRILDAALTSDEAHLVVAMSEATAVVLDLDTRGAVATMQESRPITSLATSQLRREILLNMSGPNAGTSLWNWDARERLQQYREHSQGRFVVRSCFGGFGERFVITGSEDAQVHIYERLSGILLHVLSEHAATVNCVCWQESCAWLVSASDDATLRVWCYPSSDELIGLKASEDVP